MDDDDRNREAMASAANAAYYDAFERKDFATMASLWEPSDRTVCTHPGWPPIHGTDKILQSYASIFNGPQTLQFILTNELVVADGTLAYVSIDENLVDESGSTSSTSGLNIFSWNDGRWLMVVHHASPIMSR
ncbi:MAG: SnoaL-like domain-containing protein [Acidimicrobiaceae bacterium]|uniref:YybH family protein n=1 Tax=Ilumatobacter sp. TaxID=1967498 RepID=UPI001EBE2DD5|nr:SnoaL-like domain-containing protein [Acidimicrobiaceae bacterium]MBT6445573.1 SnoaL-like domain-containing protein [Acidimicrobiaceae bacterium]